MIKKVVVWVIAIPVLVIALGLFMTFRQPGDLWINTHVFAGCPSRPSCVSSAAQDPAHLVAPLRYAGDAAAARQELERVIREMPLTTIEHATPEYLHVVFQTPTMHFRDDVELLVEPAGVIQVRSISRFGYHDQGVNSLRVALIRDACAHLSRR